MTQNIGSYTGYSLNFGILGHYFGHFAGRGKQVIIACYLIRTPSGFAPTFNLFLGPRVANAYEN